MSPVFRGNDYGVLIDHINDTSKLNSYIDNYTCSSLHDVIILCLFKPKVVAIKSILALSRMVICIVSFLDFIIRRQQI